MESNYHTGAITTSVVHLKRQAPEETTEVRLVLAVHTFGCIVQFSLEHLGTQIENRGTLVDGMSLDTKSLNQGQTFILLGHSGL